MVRGGVSGLGIAKPHAAQRGVLVDKVVFQSARDVQDQGSDEHAFEHDVQACENGGHRFGFWHKEQILAEGPPDRGKAGCRGMVDPAAKGHQHQRAIKQPVNNFGGEGLEFTVRVQPGGFDLQ